MNNLVLIIAEAIISYIFLIIISKKYKTDGIYIYGIVATFAICMMNLKKISIIGVGVPIGMGLTTSLIIGGNIITQKRGLEELKPYILLILATAILSCCFVNLSMLLENSTYNLAINKSYDSIFKANIQIYIAFIISIVPSIYISSRLYFYIKKIQNNIALNNIFAVVITEFVGNIIFVLIAYARELKPIDIVLCIVIRYVIKLIIGIVGTVPIYITNKYN